MAEKPGEMAILHHSARQGVRTMTASAEIQAPPETAFSLLCAVEKWPLWLSFLRSAKLREPGGVQKGSEILVRSAIPGDVEQLFEVDRFIHNHQVSLVGAYSTRRRIDFRIEGQTLRSRLHARLEYPAYGGRLGFLFERVRGRKLAAQFDEAVTHFKHLVEYDTAKDALLADF